MGLYRIFILSLLLFSCKEEAVIPVEDNEILVSLGQTTTKEIDGKRWSVEFVSVIENSLCHPNVTCVWQGRIIVALKINNEDVELAAGDLTTNVEDPLYNQVEIGGTTITFSDAIDYTENSTMKVILTFENN